MSAIGWWPNAAESPTVTLTLKRGDEEVTEEIDRRRTDRRHFLAIEKITGVDVVCHDFRVQGVTVGKDAQGEVNVEVEHGGHIYRGRGVSTDSVEASEAFLNAINRVAAQLERAGAVIAEPKVAGNV